MTSVAADGDRVYATAPGGQLGVFDAANGARVLWVDRCDLRATNGQEGLEFAPAIDATSVYFGGTHEAYAFTKH